MGPLIHVLNLVQKTRLDSRHGARNGHADLSSLSPPALPTPDQTGTDLKTMESLMRYAGAVFVRRAVAHERLEFPQHD